MPKSSRRDTDRHSQSSLISEIWGSSVGEICGRVALLKAPELDRQIKSGSVRLSVSVFCFFVFFLTTLTHLLSKELKAPWKESQRRKTRRLVITSKEQIPVQMRLGSGESCCYSLKVTWGLITSNSQVHNDWERWPLDFSKLIKEPRLEPGFIFISLPLSIYRPPHNLFIKMKN